MDTILHGLFDILYIFVYPAGLLYIIKWVRPRKLWKLTVFKENVKQFKTAL